MLTVADKIRGYMAERKISNAELSKRTGIKESVLSKALNNQRKIDINEYILIIEALETPADTFLKMQSAYV